MPDDQITRKELRALSDALREALQPTRFGWKRTLLPLPDVEYIIQRESVLQAIKSVQGLDWQNIHPDKKTALAIRENALHSLAVLIQSIRRIELSKLP